MLTGPWAYQDLSPHFYRARHLPYLFWVRVWEGQAEEKGCGRPEALSPWQTLNSAPGSWVRVTKTRTEEGD